MKNIIKLAILTLLISIPPAYAQNGCVIPARPTYENNQACVYAPYSGTYNTADPCYQQYLQMKSDYAAQCRVYWDNKKAESSQPAPTSAPQVIEVVKEVVVTATPKPVQKTYKPIVPTETPTPTEKPLSISQSADNYYEDVTTKAVKQSFIQQIFSSITSFFNRLFWR